jgi:hypothetical protein
MISEYTHSFGPWEIIMISIALIALILIIPFALFDLYFRKHLSLNKKVIWVLFIILAPYLGAILYLLFGRKQKAL